MTLQRPKFEKYEQVSHVLRSGKVVMKKSHQYTFTYSDESEYNIVGYIPAAMKVHYANYHSFCYLYARLCYKEVGGDIFIINGYSS